MSEDAKNTEGEDARYPWDRPEYNKIAGFFSALKQSKIESTQCNKCGTIQWPPRIICSSCLSDELSWVELPKKGKIVAFSKAYIGMNHAEQSPMIVAALEMNNGLRLLTRIVNSTYENLRIGMQVKLARASVEDGKPYWAFEPYSEENTDSVLS